VTDTTLAPESTRTAPPAYRVLARKYRPQNFEELKGQDALVRTLRNAIQSGRIHQAYMLTGVRGVGKTTTARIIARALNCIGPDGRGGPTITPCGACEQCVSIAADRNMDVLEMDAASNTGVDDVREIIDIARTPPAAARFKMFIIDEVHMLSKSAFNALLKTLEEPPPYVKFVFATTEIRKVPITVLSRCQRFDLRRVDQATLVEHFTAIAAKEGAPAEAEAISLIARAADGSVRDGLSLLDQAIALGDGSVTVAQVRDMLGLADRTRIVDLFDAAMTARPADALDILDDLHRRGADPVVVVQDLLDLAHFLTRFKIVPAVAGDVPEAERTRGQALARGLGMASLHKAWQILLKGLGEVQHAPVPHQALEMLIIRLAYAADLPSPADLLKRIQDAGGAEAAARASGGNGSGGSGGSGSGGGSGPRAQDGQAPFAREGQPRPLALAGGGGQGGAQAAGLARPLEQPAAQAAPQPAPRSSRPPDDTLSPVPRSLAETVALFYEKRQAGLAADLQMNVHPIRFEPPRGDQPGLIEIRPTDRAQSNLAGKVGQQLTEWTGLRWMVLIGQAKGGPTLREQEREAETRLRDEVARHPAVQAVLAAFPGAKIEQVRDLGEAQALDTTVETAVDDGADTVYDDALTSADDDDYTGEF